jgi:hypothetical protein
MLRQNDEAWYHQCNSNGIPQTHGGIEKTAVWGPSGGLLHAWGTSGPGPQVCL